MRTSGPGDHSDPGDPEDTLIPPHDDDPNNEPYTPGFVCFVSVAVFVALVIGIVVCIIWKRM